MIVKYRDGSTIEAKDRQERVLTHLYGTVAGRLLLKLLTRPGLSRLAGGILSTRLSRPLIRPFIRRHGIDMEQFEQTDYKSYNAFFSRRIRPEMRPIDPNPGHLIAPCDSKLLVLPITETSCFTLKQTPYTLDRLLHNDALAARFSGGWALIFRLTVDDYHRYCHIDSGEMTEEIRLPGVLHTVNPVANDHVPIYHENSRTYSLLHSDHFGTLLQMEVGALLVGRIVNHPGVGRVHRGEEKGFFQFGGSTVLVLLEAGALQPDADILENSRQGVETVVRMGERIGCSSMVQQK